MGKKFRMICTVGTSLVGDKEISEDTLNCIMASDALLFDYIKQAYEHMGREMSPCEKKGWNLIENAQNMSSEDLKNNLFESGTFNYCFPNVEIQNILRWMQNRQNKFDDVDGLHLVFLPLIEDGNFKAHLNAYAICVLLNRLFVKLDGTQLTCNPKCYREGGDILPVKINFEKYAESSREKLKSALELVIKDVKDSKLDEELVLCVTGGHEKASEYIEKYAEMHSIECISYEISYEYKRRRTGDVINSSMNRTHIMNLGQEVSELKESQDNLINSLKADGTNVGQDITIVSPDMNMYLARGEKKKDNGFGESEILFNTLYKYSQDGAGWAEYLQELCSKKWFHLWVGDQIPETVEHSREHSKRLMKFIAKLFQIAPDNMEALGFNKDHPENLAVLIAAVYLHDIGHTALSCLIKAVPHERRLASWTIPLCCPRSSSSTNRRVVT